MVKVNGYFIPMKANIEDEMLYVDYNGLLVKMNNESFKEILYIALELFGIDPNTLPFLSDINLDLDFSQIQMDGNSLDIEKVLGLISMVKGLEKDGNNLTITLDGTKIYDNANAKDMIITIESNGNKIVGIKAKNVYTSEELDTTLDIALTLNEWTSFNHVNKSKNYIDVSGASELAKAFINMTSVKDFDIKGNLDVKGTLIGININKTVGYEVKVKVVEKGKVEVYGWLGEIPAIVGVNNDVPYVFGDTESGSDRYFYFYYKDGYVYMYREEYVDQLFGASKRHYEKKVKVAIETVLSDPMTYLQYAVGFKDNIMEAIETAVQKTQNRSTPMDYSKIIKSFTINNSMSYTIKLNMAEIANNTDLDTLSLTLNLAKDSANKNYISRAQFGINMPLASVFTLELSSSDTHLENYPNAVDISNLYSYINSYSYGEGEFWHASKGNWEKASETTYTLQFVTNCNQTVSSITKKPGSTITLPTLSTYVVDDGNTKNTRTFAGWYTTERCKDGTEYNENVMPSSDTKLYAKWIDNVENYRTINFVSNCDTTFASITNLEGRTFNLPTLTTKEVTVENTTTYYEFAGWYTTSNFAEDTRFNSNVIPTTSLTLYAKWNVVGVETTYALNLYDNNVLVYSSRVKEGDDLGISELSYITNTTKYYLDANYSNEYKDVSTMPGNDLTLHIRNKYTITITSQYGDSETKTYSLYQGESFTMPTQSSYVSDDGNTRTTYTFNGFSESLTTVPNCNKTITAKWSVDVKHYYTISYDLRWYIVLGTTAGCSWKSAPPAIASEKLLEGTVIDLTKSKYKVTGTAYTTAIHIGSGKKYTSTSWGTSAWKDYTSGGSGFTSYTVKGNQTLYACWKAA